MLMRPVRNTNKDYAEQLKTLFLSRDVLQCANHSIEMFLLAASLRAEHRYKAIDTLQIATSITLGCQFFVTNDHAFESNAATEVVCVKMFSDNPDVNRALRVQT